METTFTWEIRVKNCPLLIKKCSHCDSDRFYCSDKFRMNAQKKNIDVWLIYRCVKCDNTCNMTLLSRTKPDLIDKKLFHSFSMNDREVAWQYAFSAGVASRNNLQLDYDSVEYEVINTVSLEDILNMSSEIISIQVKCDFDLSLKLSSLIKRCLPLSSTRLKLLFEKGYISFVLFTWSIVVNAQESDGRYVEVTGSSEIEVVPDEIHFLVQIKEYWQEEYTGKSKKEEDFHTKVPLAMIEKDLRKSLRKIGITDDAIRTQEIGDYWRQRGKEFLIGKQLDIRLTDFEQINSIIRSVNTWGIESMRIGELKHKDLPMYRKQGKIEALKAAREKASYLVEAMGQQLGEVIRIIEPADNNISRYLPFEAQSNVSMGAAATEQYRVIKLRYEMMARFAIK